MSALDDLGRALTAAGWCTEVRTDGPVPLLRVWHPWAPSFGDSVSIRTVDGARWFHSSTREPLALCDDVAAGRDAVIALLAPLVEVAVLSRVPH